MIASVAARQHQQIAYENFAWEHSTTEYFTRLADWCASPSCRLADKYHHDNARSYRMISSSLKYWLHCVHSVYARPHNKTKVNKNLDNRIINLIIFNNNIITWGNRQRTSVCVCVENIYPNRLHLSTLC